MLTSLDLFAKAMAHTPNQAFWCRELGLKRNTLSAAKARGRLSPTIAATLATLLHEDATAWTAIAGLEAEPPSRARDKMLTQLRTLVTTSSQQRHTYTAP